MKAKRLIGFLLCLALLLGLWPAEMNKAKAATTYGLYVGETQVTSDHLSGQGWTFSPKTDTAPNTLTLNGFSYYGRGYEYKMPDSNRAGIIYSGRDPLIINLTGEKYIKITSKMYAVKGEVRLHSIQHSWTGSSVAGRASRLCESHHRALIG